MQGRAGTTAVEGSGTFTIGELEVHRLGFGAMRITGQGIWGEPKDPEEARSLLRRVVELGVDFIDTADSYGPAISERLIREALHPYPEGFVIATKGGSIRFGPNGWGADGRPEHLREACEGSLRRLHLDRIDLYQLHTVDPHVPLEESVGALKDLQDEGKIRQLGLSNVDVAELDRALVVADVVSVQNRYSLDDRGSEDVLRRCAELGIGFIPWFPLAAGRLTKGRESIAEVARAYDATPAQIALAWLLARSPVMLPIPGTSRVDHLEENVAAASIHLTDEDLEHLSR